MTVKESEGDRALNSNQKKGRKKNPQKEASILESALNVIGEKGFEATTISDICRAAKVSESTLYEYFNSKEDVLFSIPEMYSRRILEGMKIISPYCDGARAKVKLFIQVALEVYEQNPNYASVVLLTLKGNRSFLNSPAYQLIREASRAITEMIKEGVEEGVFRDDFDVYLARNMVLGFIEHLTIQWLLLGRPNSLAEQKDMICDMVLRALEKKEDDDSINVKVKIES
jgi:TetR/AcrR family fatty acid metabolism transcriptional regulator